MSVSAEIVSVSAADDVICTNVVLVSEPSLSVKSVMPSFAHLA